MPPRSSTPVATVLPGRLTATVDMDAIAHNVAVLVDAAPTAAVMAVVKADGYGHGAAAVGRAALAAGAAELGTSTIEEALAVRAAGITAPILSWLSTSGYADAIRADIRLGISSPRQLADVVDAAREVGTTASIELKVDTGLRRNGVAPAEWADTRDAAAAAQAEGAVRVHGIFSHLAQADVPGHPSIDRQRAELVAMVGDAKAHGAASGQSSTRPTRQRR